MLGKLAQGVRYIWPDADYEVAKDSAISQRRYQLGAQPLVALFRKVCRPLTTPETAGAFLFGLRLMAIDGTIEDVPDTPANAAVFGRHSGKRGDSAFPQLQAVYLAECGSHAIVDAGCWPCHTSERVGGLRLLRSLKAGMLVMWDGGFHDFDMVQGARDKGPRFWHACPPTSTPPWSGACPTARIWQRSDPANMLAANVVSASWSASSSTPSPTRPYPTMANGSAC